MNKIITLAFASALVSACGGGGSPTPPSTPTPNPTPTPTPTPDTTAPVITLNGSSSITLTEGDSFTDQGAQASDAVDGTVAVTVSGSVGTTPGQYTLTYSATDAAGNTASLSRVVVIEAAPAPPTPPPVTPPSSGNDQVLVEGEIGTAWDKGILAFDAALDYADCTMSGGTICTSISWEFVEDNEQGQVLSISHPSNAAHAGVFIASSDAVNLSTYQNGALQFDVKVLSGDGRLTTKIDCFYPCTSGDQNLAALELNTWHTVRVSMASLIQQGLNAANVNTGLVIWATGHSNSTFLIDNVVFTTAVNGDLTPLAGGGTNPSGPVTQDFILTPMGAGSYSDTINVASYRCVFDYGNWIYSAGMVEPGIGGCDTSTGTPIGNPTPLRPQLVAPASEGPTPTHKWWGSVSFMGEMTIGDPNDAAYITPDPITARITNKGFRAMGIPGGLRVNGINFDYPIPDPFAEVFDGIAISHSNGGDMEAFLKDHGDASVTVQWQQGQNALMEATFVHGSPYVYLHVLSGDLVIKTLREDGGEKGTFATPANTLGVWTSVAGNHNNYMITGQGDTTFSNTTSNVITASNASGRFTLSYLPQADGLPSASTVNTIAANATATVAKVNIDYSVDRTSNVVTVTHSYVDDAGNPVNTLMGLHPLHWKRAGTLTAAHQVRSARGIIKFVEGNSFSYQMESVGVLPALPNVATTLSNTELTALVDDFLASGEANWKPYRDAYWSGKIYSKVAELIAITDQAGLTEQKQRLLTWLKAELADWLTAGTDTELDIDQYFAYDDEWNTLLAMEESFASHQQLNDHHFHYGYLVRAAAEVCRHEAAWCGNDQYGPMVELLIRDYAAGRDDAMFPYLRHFDPANGFSWASGKVNFVRGNNNESTSEAANAYGAMVLYGLITGNNDIVERGMYLHASTAASYWEYWNNLDGYLNTGADFDNFPPGYEWLSTSIVWGDGAVFSTWFSAAYAHILGIQGLPTNPLIMHVGLYSDYMREYVALGLAESSNGKPSGLIEDQWRDIWWNLWAMVDGELALADYESVSSYNAEAGESKAHTYHWLHNLTALGQITSGKGDVTADYPAAMVFDKAGVKSYVVYNFGDTARTVTFSDGVSVTAAPQDFTVYKE
ncbi:MAG TPA: glycosyl hydrolase [Pseudomonadales bacterium]|nr:glycosyl hydrolase [Pseudomonadales bacterium]